MTEISTSSVLENLLPAAGTHPPFPSVGLLPLLGSLRPVVADDAARVFAVPSPVPSTTVTSRFAPTPLRALSLVSPGPGLFPPLPFVICDLSVRSPCHSPGLPSLPPSPPPSTLVGLSLRAGPPSTSPLPPLSLALPSPPFCPTLSSPPSLGGPRPFTASEELQLLLRHWGGTAPHSACYLPTTPGPAYLTVCPLHPGLLLCATSSLPPDLKTGLFVFLSTTSITPVLHLAGLPFFFGSLFSSFSSCSLPPFYSF